MSRASRALLAFTASTLVLVRAAAADTPPGIDVRTWAPSPDPKTSLVLEPPTSQGFLVSSVATWLHYENDSVVLRSRVTGAVAARPLEHQVGLDVTASLGVGGRASVGLMAPMSLYEQGAVLTRGGQLPTASFGDLVVVGKAMLAEDRKHGMGLAALASIGFPTGAKTSFESDTGVTVTTRLVADISFKVVSLQASAGYSLHTVHEEWPLGSGVVFGDQIPWTFGVLVKPAAAPGLLALDPGGRQTWELALHGSLPAGPVGPFGLGSPGSAAESPVLLAVSDRVGLGRFKDGFVLVGADIGLDQAVGAPSVRVTIAAGWAFGGHDRDRDGILDDVDQCPGIAEDRDGFEDADGCPEVDNDDDGIIDGEDACPNAKGPPSADPRKNGCP
jgi:OOP family OmpA-OmpF porin